MLTNGLNGGMPTAGTGDPYFNNHVLEYTCNTGFASTDAPLTCTCNTAGATPAWSCSATFTTTCRSSKWV